MKFWRLTIVGLLLGVFLFLGRVSALRQYVYYWVGSSESTITKTEPADETSVTNFVIPHVCYDKYGNETYDLYACNNITSVGLVDIPNQIVWTYNENGEPQEKRFRLTAEGTLLPYRSDGGFLIRQVNHSDEAVPYVTLHVCNLGEDCMFDTSDPSARMYTVEWRTDGVITYAGTAEPVHILPDAIFYSYDYTHIAAFDTKGNLVLVNHYENSAQIIGYERNAIEYTQPNRPKVSVNDSSIMVSGTEGAGTFLRVYSYEVCNYGNRTSETKKYPCVVKDI